LTVPDEIKTIPNYLFYNYRFLKVLDLGKVSSVGSFSFYNSSVQAIFTSQHLKTIGASAFRLCKNIT
jgi:hypothetical protein